MAKPTARIGFVQGVVSLVILAVVARAAQVQVFQGAKYATIARAERTRLVALPAARGVIADRNGLRLADTRESYRVAVATNRVDDPHALAGLIVRSLDRVKRTQASIERSFRSDDPWIPFPGTYSAMEVERLRAAKGVDLEPIHERVYPAPVVARGAIGLAVGDSGVSGLEAVLDPLLRGVPGEAVNLRDPRGTQIQSPRRLVREPVAGNDVFLTVDAGLQEIAERALDHSLVELKARSADAVFLDPRNGEILAIATRRSDGQVSAGFLNSTFEPGSTAKLFTAAALLQLKRVDSTDTIDPEGGAWQMPIRGKRPTTREITDAHAEHEPLTLESTIQVSSNIGMAKFSQRLGLEEQYDMLRAFGFGSKTGVEFSEVTGALRLPDGTTSPDYPLASRAMGYEFSVTALQLASAYGAIAYDGVLMTPTLVREVRGPDGTVLYRHRPEPVRRVISPEVAARLRQYLLRAVGKGGTGEAAQLKRYLLIGKTGTSHQLENGRYVDRYTASFAALFPANKPILVAVVVVDAPGSASYFGGQTAAPLVKEILFEALASRTGVLNRNLFAGRVDSSDVHLAAPAVPAARTAPATVIAVPWPYRGRRDATPPGPIPDVSGASVRAAAAALHRRGFTVALHGFGVVSRTEPAAGDTASAGSTITVWAER